MTAPSKAERPPAPGSARPRHLRRWLLFVHQLPSTPSNLRVRTWRRLQQLGAIPIKQAVYVLPDLASAREDLEWLKTEVKSAGGEAAVFTASHVDAWSDDALVEGFRRARQEAYAALSRDLERALRQLGAARRPAGSRSPAARRAVDSFRERLSAIDAIDFFGAAGRDRALLLLERIEEQSARSARAPGSSAEVTTKVAASYANRLWVTRPRPGVDRMASAWLVRRFIDTRARFAFAADKDAVPPAGVPFDMFGVDFSHQGERCTFETLCAVFDIGDQAVRRVAAIVHDLDVKDGRFGALEAATVATVIHGLQLAYPDDAALLDQGIVLFDALYRAFERLGGGTTPRAAARTRRASAATRPSADRSNRGGR